jgi:hypothetical protein
MMRLGLGGGRVPSRMRPVRSLREAASETEMLSDSGEDGAGEDDHDDDDSGHDLAPCQRDAEPRVHVRQAGPVVVRLGSISTSARSCLNAPPRLTTSAPRRAPGSTPSKVLDPRNKCPRVRFRERPDSGSWCDRTGMCALGSGTDGDGPRALPFDRDDPGCSRRTRPMGSVGRGTGRSRSSRSSSRSSSWRPAQGSSGAPPGHDTELISQVGTPLLPDPG